MKEDVAERTAKLKRPGRTLCLIGVVALLVECPVAAAGPLDPDQTFNGTGKVVTDFQLDPQFAQDIGRGVAMQDGTIIAVGAAHNGGQKGDDFAVARYKSNGSPDTAFGTDGRVSTDFNSTDDAAYGRDPTCG